MRRAHYPPVRTTEGERIPDFVDYAENITFRAFQELNNRRPRATDDAEIDLNIAYARALVQCCGLELPEIEQFGKKIGIFLCQEFERQGEVLAEISGTSPIASLEQILRDDRQLPALWDKIPELAYDVSFWLGVNDCYEFAVCFANRAGYRDDFRGIRKAVEHSLKGRGLYDIWLNAEVTYLRFSPPQPVMESRPYHSLQL